MSHKRRLYKQGNSVVVSLPPDILQAANLIPGDYVFVTRSATSRIWLSPAPAPLPPTSPHPPPRR